MCRFPYVSKCFGCIDLRNSGYVLALLQLGFSLALAMFEIFDNHSPKFYVLVILSILMMLLGTTLILGVGLTNILLIKVNIVFQIIIWFVGTIAYFVAIPVCFKLLHEFLYFSSETLGPFLPVFKTTVGKRLVVLAFLSIISSALTAYLLICVISYLKDLIKMRGVLIQNATYTFAEMDNEKTKV